MHFPEVIFERHAMLDHAEAGDGVKRFVGERSPGKISGHVADGAAARGASERKIDSVEIAITVDKQRRQNIAIKLCPRIENARRSRSASQDGRDGSKMVPVFLRCAVEWDVEPACVFESLAPL